MNRKNALWIVLAIVVTAAILLTALAPSLNAILIRMPTSYICKQMEKNVPIGTDWKRVREYVGNNEAWEELWEANCGLCYHTGSQDDLDGSYSLHSFSGVDYESDPNQRHGNFILLVCLGDLPWKDPYWYLFARSANAYFVFDENQELIDIVVYKYFWGP